MEVLKLSALRIKQETRGPVTLSCVLTRAMCVCVCACNACVVVVVLHSVRRRSRKNSKTGRNNNARGQPVIMLKL